MTHDLDKRSSIIKQGLVAIVLSGFSLLSTAEDDLVGSDGGSISVGNSGQAVWNMPVEVPSGINGVAPNLSLSVSSSGGNGVLGVGGGLSGLSSITRCGRTIYQDGYFQAPQHQQGDAYCLNGARLVLESGAYGAAGSIYRTEIETFQRIKAYGSVAGKGPAYFEVTNRAGAKMVYGQRSSTQDIDPVSNAVGVWKIDHLSDSNSNTLHYHYADVSGQNEVQLTHITYGGNTTQGVVEHLSVELVYEDRPDTSTVWSRGQQYSQTKRISTIRSKVGGSIFKEYRLTYQQGEVSGASRLTELQLCASDGDCYRPSKFEYVAERESEWVPSTLSLPAALQTNDGKPLGMLIDINNDGKSDWVSAHINEAGTPTITTWLGTHSGWQTSNDFALPEALFDYSQNQDGFASGLLLDINGDGWPDFVQAYQTPAGQTIKTWRNNGTTFERDTLLDLPVALNALGSDGKVRSLADLADLNADGLVDVLVSVNTNGTPQRQAWMHQVSNDGTHSWQISNAYQPPSIAIDYTQGIDGRVFATLQDVNADGLSDWVQSYASNGITTNATWLNTGQGWQAGAQYQLPSSIAIINYDLHSNGVPEYTFTDINGDGFIVEKFYLFDTETKAWVATDAYQLPFVNHQIQNDNTVISTAEIADLNHDGYPELFNTLTGEVFETQGNSANEYPDTLVRTVNSLGAATELTYGISTDEGLYELAEQSPYPNVAYNSPVRLIKKVAASDGIGGMIAAMHKYGKAKANLLGQGGLGYAYHALQDGNTGVEVITMLHQTYPYAGRIKASSKYLDDKALSMSNSETELINITINGLTTLYPHPRSSVAHTYDLDGTLLKITRSTSQIDNFGNTTNSEEKVFDATDALVRTSTKTVDYKTPDLTRWLFGLPIKTTQTTFDVASNETFSNEAIASFAPDGKPISETLEPNSSQWVTKTYTYDGFGNRLNNTVTAAGIAQARTSSTTFTANGRFPVSVSNALNHSISSVFDEVQGKPLSVTDANGITKEFVYNGFGTTVKESKLHQSDGATRGRQIVMPMWCNSSSNCPDNAVYFIAAFDDEGDAPEIAYYDVNGKELRKQTFGFEGKIIVVETEYDHNGKVTKVTQPYFKGDETPTWTEYEYDILGRQIKRKNPEGHYFYTRYEGLEVITTNPGNKDTAAHTNHVVNNIFGQPLESIDADGNSTFYQYDGRGKLIKTTDAHDNPATIEYDPVFGRKIAMNDPDLGVWRYEYDALGNLTAQIDAKGQRTEMTYDILNRLVRRVDAVGAPQEEITAWEYSTIKGNGEILGGLKKVISPNYERTVKYDDFSRMVEATSIIDGQTFTQRTGYLGSADKVDWVEYPSGLSVRNTYDDYGYPKTVEGITLDYAKYEQFQIASQELNDLRRQLEAYKDQNLSETNLFKLEEHERQVRRLGKALSDFYDELEDNPIKQAHDDEAQRYTDLVDRVQDKLTQHGNWHNIYQTELDSRYANIKDDLERLEELGELSEPHQEAYDEIKPLYDNYISKETYYANKINEQGAVINYNIQVAQEHRGHVNTLLTSLFHAPHDARYSITEDFDTSGIELMQHELDCCAEYVLQHYSKTLNGDLFSGHLTSIGQHTQIIGLAYEAIAAANQKVTDGDWETWHSYWKGRRENQEVLLTAATDKISEYGNESASLNARVKPDLDRINDWLSPITQSHNNVILSFNGRARAYVSEISKRTGSYAKRDDLKSENFLKPFKNHVEYSRCLRDQSAKSTGDCYAENLVYVLDDDGEVDEVKQAEARAEVEHDALVDVKALWSNKRFFCPVYFGYDCPTHYVAQIRELAKVIHSQQCARLSDYQKDKSAVPCDTEHWADTWEADGPNPPKHRYLLDDVADISLGLNDYYAALVSEHEQIVASLVTTATLDTYNAESNYADIIELGGNLWEASTPEPVEEGETDPREFVLLHQGNVQLLARQLKDAKVREADTMLREHQYAIAMLLNDIQSQSYEQIYLAVQDKAAEVDKLYKEIDEAYALAANDDEFDADAFDANKKIYWQAQDINSKGQIKQAKYGNGTVTQWGYDQFGRINNHLTKNATDLTVLSNAYEYDALGNLAQRTDSVENLTEQFSYDVMNRLILAQVQGDVVNYGYDELGNLIYKSDIMGGGTYGHYTYGNPQTGGHAGPHAVTSIIGLGDFTYDNNGNQLTGNGRIVQYSAFNKPTSILKDGKQTKLWYGPGLFEQISQPAGGMVQRHHISIAGQAIAIVETEQAQTDQGTPLITKEHYLHKNHQGSVLAITDQNGDVVERRYYDAFGDIKSYIGQAGAQYAQWIAYNAVTDLGFTGHKTLVAAGVIHMGGRVYDATIGRFLSADPHIQAPLNSQSLNRYSYTLNNPLSWTDPSGYFFSSIFKALKKLFNKIKKIIKKILKVVTTVLRTIAKNLKKIGQFIKKYARVIVAVVAAVAVPFALAAVWGTTVGAFTLSQAVIAGAVAGGVSGLISTGSLKGLLEGAAFGALTAGFAKGLQLGKFGLDKVVNKVSGALKVSQSIASSIVSVTAHGVLGGLRAVVNGGKFFAGFVTGAVSKAFTIGTRALTDNWDVVARGFAVAAVGGAVSALAGGSFELGFLTAGLAFAVNEVFSESQSKRVNRYRNKSIKKIDKLRGLVTKAQDGNNKALRGLNKRFGAGVEDNLEQLNANLERISSELSTATLVAGDVDYLAKRLAAGADVGAYVDHSHPDTIFLNPKHIGSELSPLLVHEAAHLAGIGHQKVDGGIVYGNDAARDYAESAGWPGTKGNASNYGCAVYYYAKNC